jgi:hypothetical protein
MNKEKQIEEMAKDICGLGRDCHGCTASMSYICKAKKYAERAVDKGYRKEDIDIMGYQSPIEIVMGQMRMEQENNIYKVIQEQGVNVDKNELIKALKYDRDQYEKGYINGYNAKASELAREIFEEIERFLYMHFRFCKEEIGNDDTEYVKGRLELNTQIQNLIAELKKKYTENKGE